MNIVVIGSGYVGTTAAVMFALSGYKVTAVDIDVDKIKCINSGKAPFYEEGLDKLVKKSVESGNLIATNDYRTIKDADVVISCVGTPDNEDGSSNLEFVYGSASKASSFMKPGTIYVQKSTVPVGTGRKVMQLLSKNTPYVSNPEFLREGTAIADTVLFDRVVTGGDNREANNKILAIHKDVEKHGSEIIKIAGLDINPQKISSNQGEYVSTRLESAELIKVTANAFLALKISFANSIAKLCDKTNADIIEVMGVVGSDTRIGKAFFNAGRGYGGGCFPKDVSGLISSAKSHGVDMSIMSAATSLNDSMPGYILASAQEKYGDLTGKNVTVLGLSFKSGTSDTRKSPALKLANKLALLGASVIVHDPQAIDEATPELSESIKICRDLKLALMEAEVVVVATDWPEYISIKKWKQSSPNLKLLIDAVNCIPLDSAWDKSIQYIGVGKRQG